MNDDVISRELLALQIKSLEIKITGLRESRDVRRAVQEYRASVLRLIEELPAIDDKNGSLEKLWQAVEKQKPQIPDYEGDGCDKDGNIIFDTWICPNCGEKYEVDYDDYKYCPECGQKIRWN